jgi:hypothetical protein
VTGDREVLLGEGDGAIWADGLQIDPDAVVVAEAKFIESPGRSSMYEGKTPPGMADRLMLGFDREIQRYGALVRSPDNPVRRLRIITSTQAAADFLGARARKILGPTIDLDVRHTP